MTKHSAANSERNNLIRLLDGLDFYREWRLATERRAQPGLTQQEIKNQVVMPGAEFLALYDQTKGRAQAGILKEVQAWYAHTASDLVHLAALSADDRAQVDAFLAEFQQTQGFSFLAEAGVLRKAADRVLQRGALQSEEEYYLLKELLLDGSQTHVSADEVQALSSYLAAFEQAQRSG